MTVTIRETRGADVRALYDVLTHLHDEPPWDSEQSPAAERALESIAADPRRRLFLAQSGKEPVGSIDVTVIPNVTRGLRPFAIVENVVVVSSHRRMGVGRALMEAALAFATSQGCYKVQLVSAKKRDAAHHLYDAVGFDADVSGYRKYLPVRAGET